VNKIQEMNMLFGTTKPIIGMLHLKPLPGSPIYDGKGLGKVIDVALKDAQALVDGGVNALQVENYNDPSYFPNDAPPETISALTIVAHEVRKRFPKIPMGICLLADPEASIAVAHCVGAQYIRATFFTEASVDVSGLVTRLPHAILRYRKFLDPSVKILADVHIKHSAPLGVRPIEEAAYDAAYFLADAIIISGKHTGMPTNIEEVKRVKKVLPEFPVYIGSGINAKSVEEFFEYADGAICGSSLKCDGISTNEVDVNRVKEFMNVVEKIRKKQK
jgi:membrane complex biogenesis BtpA family protein